MFPYQPLELTLQFFFVFFSQLANFHYIAVLEMNAVLKGSFAAASLWWRIAIVAAGPIANFILGILLFAMVYMTAGKIFLPAQIGEVMPETAAAEAGLRPGDMVTEIDGISVRDFNDMRGLVVESPGRALDFTILRDGRELTLDVTPTPRFNEELQIYMGVYDVKNVLQIADSRRSVDYH